MSGGLSQLDEQKWSDSPIGTSKTLGLIPGAHQLLINAGACIWRRISEMRVGVAADHDGFDFKKELTEELLAIGHDVIDFGARELDPDDDYADFVIPLARALAAHKVERGIALCASSIGASICANKIPGVRAGAVYDQFSVWQSVETNYINLICLDNRTGGRSTAWDLVQTFLAAEFRPGTRNLERLGKLSHLETTRSDLTS
jgi:ribose 5-phosphate isomerase B